jgi:mono/diheme cytochrome c family protein
MDEKRYTYRVQWLVLAGAALLFILLVIAWARGVSGREWKRVQREYAGILEQAGGSDPVVPEKPERGIFQVQLPFLNRVDRCISCHPGIEDTRMEGMPQPYALHPGKYLEDHPVQKYGCTICHGGQGMALNREDAFGRLPGTHWPHPLLEQPYIQASCGKCHLAIFNLSAARDTAAMAEMEIFVRGKSLFAMEGCLGCHKARGIGGILGPDLTRQGEKTRQEYSFQHITGEQTVSNWLKEHFRDPEMVSPGSQMLQINLEEKELETLAIFVMGLAKPDIPFDYFTMDALSEFKGVRDPLIGDAGYAYLCAACHGKRGEGKSYKEYKTGIPSIGATDFLRVASVDFIRFTVEKGRSMRQMGSWNGSISGTRAMELDSIVIRIKQMLDRPGLDPILARQGDREAGRQLYRKHCMACHGENGSGGVAVVLNQPGLLDRANDRFIQGTVLRGRSNTAMPGWSQLGERDLADLLAFIKGWQGTTPVKGTVILPGPDLEEGALRYHFLCSRCHGEFGEGETGPAIINREFLELADNRFLFETIAQGRVRTAMFGWSADVYNQEKLDVQDIGNIIGFLRQSAREPLTYLFPGSNPGDRERGAGIFRARCSECHGSSGEGTGAPALNNQEFLSAATNGFLLATITLGRGGTAMPPWGYGQDAYPALSGKERQDLVAYLRSLQRIRIKF